MFAIDSTRKSLVIAASAAVLLSCSDTSDPLLPREPVKVATVLVAVTPTSLTGFVGSSASEKPAVLALDANGDPVAGFAVIFTVASGGGRIQYGEAVVSGLRVTSNEAGIASVPGWSYGYVPGVNLMVASSGNLPAVSFTAVTVPSRTHTMVKLAGDDEVRAPGKAVSFPPALLVQDIYGNGIAGVPVSFTVARGAGSITGGDAVTDGTGRAATTSWTLGPIGEQEVVATYAGIEKSLVFRTVSADPVDLSCAGLRALARAPVIQTELGSGICRTTSGRPFDLHSIVIDSAGLYRFSVSSSVFHSYIEMFDSTGVLVSRNDGKPKSEIKAYLRKGRYTLSVTSISPLSTGSYDISWDKTTVDLCEMAAIVPGVVVATTARSCSGSPSSYTADRYRFYLRAGSGITMQIDYSDVYLEPALRIMNTSGTTFAQVWTTAFTKRLSLAYVASTDGLYTLAVEDFPPGTSYTLTLQ